MLDWLESTGRLLDREVQEQQAALDGGEEEISEFLGGEESGFDDLDDDDDDLDLDD